MMLNLLSSPTTYILIGTFITIGVIWFYTRKFIHTTLTENINIISNRLKESQQLKNDANDAVSKMEVELQDLRDHLDKTITETKHELQNHRTLLLEHTDNSLKQHLLNIDKNCKESKNNNIRLFLKAIENDMLHQYAHEADDHQDDFANEHMLNQFLHSKNPNPKHAESLNNPLGTQKSSV